MKKRERVWISGDRFEAVVSPDRKRADIVDRRPGGAGLFLLDRESLEEISEFVGVLRDDRSSAGSDVVDRKSGRALMNLSARDVQELDGMVREILSLVTS